MAGSSPKSLEEVLDDLCSRFIINLPNEELESFDRLCFQIEAAHWFYLDFFREEYPSLPVFNLKEFGRQMFQHCPLLQPFRGSVDQILANFTQYKVRVPACGAIILNPNLDKCLLVKGWTNKSSWGFPKGKINKDELESDCAIREVFEETSFDITPYLKEEDHIEVVLRETEQRVKLFIIAGVPEDTHFYPRTRKEISKISWFPLSEFKTEKPVPQAGGGGVKGDGKGGLLPMPSPGGGPSAATAKSKNYFMVIPFVSKLKIWLKRRKPHRKIHNSTYDNMIVTAYDSSTNLMPPPTNTTSTTATPLSTNPTPTSSQEPPKFIPLPEPISLMHLLTPPRNNSSSSSSSSFSSSSSQQESSTTPHRPIPHPHIPLPAPYPIPHNPPQQPQQPQQPQNVLMTPPHQIQQRTAFHTSSSSSFHTPSPSHQTLSHAAPNTYPHLPPKTHNSPPQTPQPKTQPSTPYTPYPISPPSSPSRSSHTQESSPVQLQFQPKDRNANKSRTEMSRPLKPRRVDFGNQNLKTTNAQQVKTGNAFTNFRLNADEIMRCFVQL